MSEPTKNPNETWKRVLEQSFIVVCLSVGFYFLFVEYKAIFHRLNEKNERDERLLMERVKELNIENQKIYERLINCKNGTND